MFGFKKKIDATLDAVKHNADVATAQVQSVAADVKRKSKIMTVFAGIQALAFCVIAGACVYSAIDSKE